MVLRLFILLTVFPIVCCRIEHEVATISSVDETSETQTSTNVSQNGNSSDGILSMVDYILQVKQMLNDVILALAENNRTLINETPHNSTNEKSTHNGKTAVSIRIGGGQHCGGSIINRMYILTAGHCVKGEDVTKFEIIAAVADVMDDDAIRTTAVSGKVHERFHSSTFDYDVAILKLVKPLPLNRGIKPICLPDPDDDPVSEIAVVTGWGALKETDKSATDHLNEVEIPIISNKECKKAKKMRGQVISDRMICGGYLDGSKDACMGDSGGPLVLQEKGVWRQIGIVSWGIGCARPGFYGIYSRVSALLSWIATNTPDGKC